MTEENKDHAFSEAVTNEVTVQEEGTEETPLPSFQDHMDAAIGRLEGPSAGSKDAAAQGAQPPRGFPGETVFRYETSQFEVTDHMAAPNCCVMPLQAHRYFTPVPNPFQAQPASAVSSSAPPRVTSGLTNRVVALALLAGLAAGAVAGVTVSRVADNSNSLYRAITVTAPLVDKSASKTVEPATSLENVAAKVLPSVVMIQVAGTAAAGSGSGIILNKEGDILTNNHVVTLDSSNNGQVAMMVNFNNGAEAKASVVGTDPVTDLAVIHVDPSSLPAGTLVPATFGDSASLRVGAGVVAVGSPFGLDSTVTSGIVSALNRPVTVGKTSTGAPTVYPAIQTDAAINPGNSGGALADMRGRIVGINAAIQSTSSASSDGSSEAGSIGLGFAIPVNEALPLVEQMLKGETPTHARLGLEVSPVGAKVDASGKLTYDKSNGPFGAIGAEVQTVTNGGAAAAMGLRKGDIVTKINNLLISDSNSLVATVRGLRPNDSVTITWVRDGKVMTGTGTLGSDVSTK